ncbi:MAG: chemotaxis protein CheW [Thermaerobacter sp.]|nr:chemotaxis protein CheW [Thermaerobacter sp.]
MAEVTQVQLVLFELQGELYAVEAARVQEIVARQPETRVPRTPGYVVGIVNLRGRVIPTVDLLRRFGLGDSTGTATQVVVVELRGSLVGFIVDLVTEVLNVPLNKMEPPPETVVAGPVRSVSAILEVGGRLASVLDLDLAFSPEEMQQEEALQGHVS